MCNPAVGLKDDPLPDLGLLYHAPELPLRSTSTHPTMPTGFLAVWSTPGSQVSLDEFHDWYDNEHVPLRTVLPAFLSAARFSSMRPTDIPSKGTKGAGWLAIYDVTDPSVFSAEIYTDLRAKRSAREASVIGRLELLDRRSYVLVGECTRSRGYEYGSGAGRNPGGVVGCIITQGLDYVGAEEAMIKWLENIGKGFIDVDGWISTRMFRCLESSRNGTSVRQGEPQTTPNYLVLHGTWAFLPGYIPSIFKLTMTNTYICIELSNTSAASQSAFEAALRSQLPDDGFRYVDEDEGQWELYRAYETVSHKQQI